MVWVETSRRTLQLLALELRNALHHLPPLSRSTRYGLPDLVQQRWLMMPESSPGKYFCGPYVQVEPHTVSFLLSLFVPEVHCQPGLVRALVFGEAYVSVYAEQGPAERLWVPYEVRADRFQLRCNVFDESNAS